MDERQQECKTVNTNILLAMTFVTLFILLHPTEGQSFIFCYSVTPLLRVRLYFLLQCYTSIWTAHNEQIWHF